MKVLMSGGGTAGHVYPALTVAARLAAERDEVRFVGTPTGLESRLVPEAGIEFESLSAAGFDRARPWTLLTSSIGILLSALKAYGRMGHRRPDVVIGFGGYVSIPVGLAAVWRGVPLVLHEQNSVPGLANRFLSRFAKAVAVTYEESAVLLRHPDRVVVTGNPVRASVLEASRERGRVELDVSSEETLLLAFGGSRGARHLNQALVALAPRLMAVDGLRIVHAAGPAEASSVREMLAAVIDVHGRWKVVEYLDQMGDAMAAADLLVTRAGATSLAEMTCLGRPAVLVPYPYATDDHQTKNAATLVEHGAALLVPDAELDESRFGDELVRLLEDESARATMSAASHALGRPDAAQRVVDVVKGAVNAAAHRSDA